MKKVSIITPTYNRGGFLFLLRKYVLAQTYPNIEWLIYDDSEEVNKEASAWAESNIHYIHSQERVSIGEKRNRLIEKATGEIIVHFDDDDYYAPGYVAEMLDTMQSTDSDFVNLKGFFLYNVAAKVLGHWDLRSSEGLHFDISHEGIHLTTLMGGLTSEHMHLAYGFSYCYKKEVWGECKFPDVDFCEDAGFVDQMREKGFKHGGQLDNEGIALHYIHGTNTSRCFPQHIIPLYLSHKFFPTYLFSS